MDRTRTRLRSRLGTRLGAVPEQTLHLRLMLTLTFTTGIIDAVGYLGLDKVFTGNMTGNVVILAMGVTGSDDLPVLGPLLALAGFMAGAAAGGRALRRTTHAWSPRTAPLFVVVGVVVAALGVVLLAVGRPSHGLGVVVTTVLGAAMGLQAATARVVAVKDVTTVVVTSTLTGLAADSVLGSGRAAAAGGGSGRRAVAVLLLLLGAGLGAALLRVQLGTGLLVAGLVILLAAGLGSLHHTESAPSPQR